MTLQLSINTLTLPSQIPHPQNVKIVLI